MQTNTRLFFVLAFALITSLSAFGQSSLAPVLRKKQIAPATQVQKQVSQLTDMVASQQKQLETQGQQLEQLKQQLQQLLNATQQTNATAQKGQSNADQAQTAATQAQHAADEAQRIADQASANAVEAKTALAVVNTKTQDEDKKLNALQDVLGRFRLSGDVRIRGEGFYQDNTISRNRARVRVRLGLDGKLNDDFIGGLAIATGTLGDPTTTNETLTNFFDRKTIALDRGYITYNPQDERWLSLTGGKFAYPWMRTSLTTDPDINPEGFDERVSFDLHSGGLKNFSAQAFQLLFNENSKGDDSFGLGASVSATFKAGPWTSTPSFTLLDWRFPDALLSASSFAAQATTTTGGLQVPGEGPGCAAGFGLPAAPPCAFAANGLTNATFTDASGKAHFLSGFTYADFIWNNQIKTASRRLPLNIVLEYEDNLNAASHPLNNAGNVISSLGSQGKAYLGDISIGQSKDKNDIQVGYAYWRTEQDAIIASWAESDQRAPTNILQNKIYGTWKLRDNVTAGYTLFLGRTLNSNLEHAILGTGVVPGQTEPILKRQEFDLNYVF
ncbi:MAG TPA: putative porin [Terriglobales bacterium]|jgi:hypothetical protein